MDLATQFYKNLQLARAKALTANTPDISRAPAPAEGLSQPGSACPVDADTHPHI